MSKFGFITRMAVPQGEDGWRWMPLPDVSPEAKILVAMGTLENREMLNRILDQVEDTETAREDKSKSERYDESIGSDRDHLKATLIKGWAGMWEVDEEDHYVLDDSKQRVPIEFSPENLIDFVDQIPESIVVDIRQWCQDRSNFSDYKAPRLPNANNLGNS